MGIKTLAFPAIGTGVGGLNAYRCAVVMIDTVIEFTREESLIEKLYFVLFDDKTCEIFSNQLKRLLLLLK